MDETAISNEGPRYEEAPWGDVLRDGFRFLLRGMKDTPAVVLSPSRDVLMWNPLGCALLAWHLTGLAELATAQTAKGVASKARDAGTRPNCARMLFLDPRDRHLYPQWEHETAREAAVLRQAVERHPDDPALAALIGELRDADEYFASLWPRVAGRVRPFGVRKFLHPVVGPLELAYENIQPHEPGPCILVFSAEPDSPSERALRDLTDKAAAIR
ncbi:hypothetical protein [Streptomyces mirabilis]|uniref:MmyB family transcriptional regulator n=1 Tax=Streptomyces mirabilis TaxID=68239 RepID=UPI00331AA6B2